MSLSDLASLGTFVSSFAVLISLALLYFQVRQVSEQVRQGERNQRATIAQVRTSRVVDSMLHLCEPPLADAFTKVTRGHADSTSTQVQQFVSFARAVFANAEDAFIQHRQGLLEDIGYRAWLALFGDTMARIAFRLSWELFGRASASREFGEFVDQLIDQKPLRIENAELATVWKSGFAELSATVPAPAPT